MGRLKIDYGIDLGTTNSAIARMENGQPIIKKTDTLKDTMPSCVSFNKKRSIIVGDSAFYALKEDKLRSLKNWEREVANTHIEFKRTMGTDKKYIVKNMERNYASEELSAEVLKTLKAFVTDEEIKSVIITVPAKFTINQKDATTRAGKIAGFQQCELLQEPIAASMAYGLDTKSKNGYWLVFDFGGGTFDVALLRIEDGIMKVIDTEGDNYLGGKNLDFAIVDEIIIPYLRKHFVIENIIGDDIKREILREAMKSFAEFTKIQMSFKDTHNILSDLGEIKAEDEEGNEFEIDLTITQEDMKQVAEPIFQKAINITKDLLKRNNLDSSRLDSLILVGGPTYSPILRDMIKLQITDKISTNVDPMTVVAKGAALYASTINIAEEILNETKDIEKIQLNIGYEPTTVEEEEYITVKFGENSHADIPEKVFCEIIRGDKAWSSGKVEVGKLGEVIEVKMNSGQSNLFNIILYNESGDILESEPQNITIIQGTKVGSASLPYYIGIETKSLISDKIEFTKINGLEKNQSIPAKGVLNGLKTQKQLNPGLKEDFIRIPIYQGEYYAEGSRAIYNEHVYDIIISGEDIPSLLPENSDVDLTFDVNRSEKMFVKAYFPLLDYTCEIEVPTNNVQKEIDANWLSAEILKTKQSMNFIKEENVYKDVNELELLDNEVNDLEKLFEQGKTDYDRKKQVLDNLRRVLRTIDNIQEETEWPKTEEELKSVFYQLEEDNRQFGNEKTTNVLNQLKEQIPGVIKEKNIKLAKELIGNIRAFDFSIVDEGLGPKLEIGLLYEFNENFNTHDWSDRNRARLIINQGLQIAVDNPTKERLRPLIIELFKLLPKAERPIIPGSEDLLTH